MKHKKFCILHYAFCIMLFVYFLLPTAYCLLPLAVSAQVTINTSFPVPSSGPGPGGFVNDFYRFSLMLGGILAFGAIVYGGIRYIFAAGNPSGQSDGKEWIKGALWGLALLGGAYLILNVINPNLTKLSLPGLEPVAAVPAAPAGGILVATSTAALCSDLPATAKGNNEPYPAKSSPELDALISCLHGAVSFSAPTFTYDQSHPTCNFTRGFSACDPSQTCSHARNSCHYGGRSGNDGSKGVDFAIIGSAAQQIIDAAYSKCGLPKSGYAKARCEAASGVMVPCSAGGGATHVHISTASCDAN
jgi:hypothetical protein